LPPSGYGLIPSPSAFPAQQSRAEPRRWHAVSGEHRVAHRDAFIADKRVLACNQLSHLLLRPIAERAMVLGLMRRHI
jgi:hypothetical protein